ncbi:Maf family protein [Pseudorhodobacter ferrugineus]|uniref:Maf family protein n=1 Tax=Pseudorhodobacter ferrugineus TaxID=77008 RepID=UPI0003B4C811|nr:nucleoside triphosphate pyrophosphatase [Pseudorhodobacter ferrugineus]
MAAPQIILASSSETRQRLLSAAGLTFAHVAARIDEDAIRASLEADGAKPLDIADLLAEMKARKLAEKHFDALVLGCDQVLDFKGKSWGKPASKDDAIHQLTQLRGQTHHLLSAIVAYHQGEPVWRHVGKARLTMHEFSDEWLASYVIRNWDGIRHSAGCYLLEGEGVRLFSAVDGDYFTILGLPLLPLLGYLRTRGFIVT